MRQNTDVSGLIDQDRYYIWLVFLLAILKAMIIVISIFKAVKEFVYADIKIKAYSYVMPRQQSELPGDHSG